MPMHANGRMSRRRRARGHAAAARVLLDPFFHMPGRIGGFYYSHPSSCAVEAFRDALGECAFWYALRDAGRFAFRRDPSCATWAYVRSKYQVAEAGLYSLLHCPTEVKFADKKMSRLANQLDEDAEEMMEALVQYNTTLREILDLCESMPELEDM